MKWMAEYFLAAWALHEACTCADTFCLLPAASADTAKDATSTVASVEISSFFMFISPLPPDATKTLNHASSFPIFSCQLFRNNLARSLLAQSSGYWSTPAKDGQGDGVEMFKAVCKLGLEGIVSKKLYAPYKSGPSKAWLKIKNPKASAATRVIDGTF
jgi:hypothetical protein